MQHPGGLLGVVLGAVGQPEAHGHVEVDLHRGALPGAPDGVLHLDVDLRAVEGAVALVDVVGEAPARTGLLQRFGGVLPHVVGADGLVRARGDLGLVGEAEGAHDVVHQLQDGDHLVDHLILGAEDVGVVLGEAAGAKQAVDHAGHLVAVHGAELEVAQRQVAVGVQLVLVDDHVARAVHGFHAVLGVARLLVSALVDLEEVHVLVVEAVMARGLPHVRVVDVRGDDLLVAALVQIAAQPLLQRADDARALGKVQRQAHAGHGLHHVDAQLAAKLAMVALLGLLQVVQVLLQLLLVEERRAVDAGEHLVVRVALPVGAGHLGELVGAELAGVGHVRPAAQIGEVAELVDGDGLVLGQLVYELELERLIGEDLPRLVAGDLATGDGGGRLGDLGHARLDGGEVVRRDGRPLGQLDVVVEAVLDGRADAELHAGIQIGESGGQEMGRGMAHELEALVALGGDDGHGIAVGDDGVQIDGGVVDDAGQRRAGEPSADGGGHVGDGGALFQLLDGSVGQYDVHGTPFLAPGAHRAPARFPPGR